MEGLNGATLDNGLLVEGLGLGGGHLLSGGEDLVRGWRRGSAWWIVVDVVGSAEAPTDVVLILVLVVAGGLAWRARGGGVRGGVFRHDALSAVGASVVLLQPGAHTVAMEPVFAGKDGDFVA